MSSRLLNLRASLVAASLLVAGSVYATDVVLDLNVSGTILAGAEWRNGSDTTITAVTFDFGSFQAGDAARNVDSGSQTVKLFDPANSAGSINATLATPDTCTIGADAITDSHVLLVFGGTEFSDTGTIAITESASNTLILRFDDAGSYGDKSGAVSCTNAGTLTYTY